MIDGHGRVGRAWQRAPGVRAALGRTSAAETDGTATRRGVAGGGEVSSPAAVAGRRDGDGISTSRARRHAAMARATSARSFCLWYQHGSGSRGSRAMGGAPASRSVRKCANDVVAGVGEYVEAQALGSVWHPSAGLHHQGFHAACSEH